MYRLCNPEANYEFEKRLLDYIIQNITERYFLKYENLWRWEKNIWRCRKKQSRNNHLWAVIVWARKILPAPPGFLVNINGVT